MLIGYARTSTVDQAAGYEAQQKELKALGAGKLFAEQVSSVAGRAQLEAALEFIREGDTLIVTKLDRLARSIRDLLRIVDRLKAKGAALRIVNMQIDTATPQGKLMLTMLGGIAEFEREMMLERQREGIAKAKIDGRYKGRQPTARAKAEQIIELSVKGMTKQAIASQLGIGVASVYRVLRSEAAKCVSSERSPVDWTM